MNEDREIEGKEFDWFAVDEHGRFALFATAGSGPIPPSVHGCIASHDAIEGSIEVVGWGSAGVWESYSRVGLFAYDWSESQNRYLRVAEPGVSLDTSLATRITSCPGLPRLDMSFSRAAVVRPPW